MPQDNPYVSFQFAETHPDRLATLGRLFGMPTADPTTARVLEIGCGDGGNLLPIAESIPLAELTGFDLSEGAIASAKQVARRFTIQNVHLEQANILDFEPRGEFDYIIAHGVYSWVSAEVRRALLNLVASSLAENGVGYISFNAQPGWHLRSLTREIVRRGAGEGRWEHRVARGQGFLSALAKALTNQRGSYAALIQEEAAIIESAHPTYVLGEHLADENRAFFFSEFVDDLRAVDLRYLCEAEFHASGTNGMPADLQKFVRQHSTNQDEVEANADLARGTRFRRALVTHASNQSRHPEPAVVQSLRISCAARPLAEKEATFEMPSRRRFAVSDAMVKVALHHVLDAWPKSVPFRELTDRVRRSGQNLDVDRLAAGLLWLYSGGCVEFTTLDAPATRTPPERPRTSPLARHYASLERDLVPNLRHQSVSLRADQKRVLCLLDGTSTVRELAERAQLPLSLVESATVRLAVAGFVLDEEMTSSTRYEERDHSTT